MSEGVDTSKRQFLTSALSVVGAVGAGYLAVPFLSQMQPSAKAMAAGAPVEVDLSKMEPGQLIRVAWRGKPVWILNRTPEVLETLGTLDSKLADPNSNESLQPVYTKNALRAIKPEIFVAIGLCTHKLAGRRRRPRTSARFDLGINPVGRSSQGVAGRFIGHAQTVRQRSTAQKRSRTKADGRTRGNRA